MVLPKSCKIRSERGANSFSLSCRRLPKRLRGWRQVGKEEDRGGGHSSETTTYKRSLWTLRVERSCTKDWDNEPVGGNYGEWGDICELGQVTLSR